MAEDAVSRPLQIDVVTIFPAFFEGPLGHGILRRAQEAGLLSVATHDLRQFTSDRHKTVDDRPFGGEEGMVLKPEPLFLAVENIQAARTEPGMEKSRVILLSAQGKVFCQSMATRLAQERGLILICGRYEGVDERVAESLADEEISIGDYVLSGGEIAATVIVDTVARLLPGAVGNAASVVRESFTTPEDNGGAGLLDWPHYTRPATFRGMGVPEELLSGDHKRIAAWRRRRALEKTWKNRPDLLARAELSLEQKKWLAEFEEVKRNEPTRKVESNRPPQGDCGI
jgi:tRNA (guanine37-N1)-methyltransferase